MPKIFDCFLFFNELDLLEIRLHELDPVVDHFVICEATATFSGKQKPLYFHDNRERFEPFLKKIIHVVFEDMPKGRKGRALDWRTQKFQRNAISRGLADAKADDFVVLSDLDEIPRATAVESIARASNRPAVYSLLMEDRRYFVNLVDLKRRPWERARMARRGDIRKMETLRAGGPTWRPNHPKILYTLRQWKRMSFGMRRLRPWISVPNAGWHFSYMRGAEAVSEKLHAVSAMKPETATSVDAVNDHIKRLLEDAARSVKTGNSIIQELDASFPAYFLANRRRFSHFTADRGMFERYGVRPPDDLIDLATADLAGR